MNKLLHLVFFIFLFAVAEAQDVNYTLVNTRNINEGGIDYHLADVIVKSDDGFKLGSGQLYFNYDTSAFGANIKAHNNIQILAPQLSTILGEKISYASQDVNFFSEVVINDNTRSRFSISWQQSLSGACYSGFNVIQTLAFYLP
jgi:hypothetical protein